MHSNLSTKDEESRLLPPKKDQGLRRVYSDASTVADSIIKDINLTMRVSEAESVQCECCGMSEDCTPTYIGRIKEFFCGKWICGLCSEAVKEKLKRAPALTVEEALESHMALCMQFNRTTRLNPKLSLAGAMRDIARKSSQHRSSKDLCPPKIARTKSCGPWMDVKSRSSTIG